MNKFTCNNKQFNNFSKACGCFTLGRAAIYTAAILASVVIVLLINVLTVYAADDSAGKMYSGLKNIAPYTYEITYDDYIYDAEFQTVSKDKVFGCSSVRNGNNYGRNFDYVFNDTPEFVVRMKANDNRYASVGIAQHWGLRDDELQANKYDKQLELVPNLTLDGINEKSVVANINVVPRGDVAEVTGTNPGAEDLHMLHIVRYILDNAGSADEAVDLIKKRNIVGSLGQFNLHLMVADKNKTYIVEFLDNKVVAEEKKGNEQIMTNFYNNLDELTEYSQGVERYEILKDNYSLGETEEGMFWLLEKASFIHLPEMANDLDTAWASDTGLGKTVINSIDRTTVEKEVDGFINSYKSFISDENNRKTPDDNVWITVHNTTYNIESKTMTLCVQQDYSKIYTYVVTDELGHRPQPFTIWVIIAAVGACILIFGCWQGVKYKNKPKK